MILIKDLSYKYKDGTKALENINLKLEKRKIAIMGANGSGKSTLLLHFNGVILPQVGIIEINGMDVNKKNSHRLKNKVGIVFQDPDDQVFSTTVWEDVAFGPENMDIPTYDIEKRVEVALKKVGMLKYKDKYPHNLSYGQKKKVALAGILAMDFEILILDEPLAYLDPLAKKELLVILDKLYKAGKTIIIATHDVNLASSWSEEVVILKNGRILQKGNSELLLDEEIIQNSNLELPILAKYLLNLGYKRERIKKIISDFN